MTNDKQKDRLVELFNQLEDPSSTCPHFETGKACKGCKYLKGDNCDLTGRFADFFLVNGVIVLPNLRYRQTVYQIYNNKIMPLEVTSYMVRPEFDNLVQIHLYRNGFNGCCTMDDFGKTVFLTKEEAEEALSKLQASCKQVNGGVQG